MPSKLVVHADAVHMRPTWICAVLSSTADTGMVSPLAVGSPELFSMQICAVTLSPTLMLLGLHGWKPGQMVGEKLADPVQTDIPRAAGCSSLSTCWRRARELFS